MTTDRLINISTNSNSDYRFWLSVVEQLPGLVFVGTPNEAHTLLEWRGDFPVVAPLLERAGFDLGGLDWADFILAEDRQEVTAEIQAAAAEGRPYRLIYRIDLPGRAETWVLERGCVNKDGQLVGFLTDHTDRMKFLSQRERQLAILEERSRLARELHDSISQSLYSIALFAEAGRTLIQQGKTDDSPAFFEEILAAAQQTQKEMRLLVHKLRPSQLASVGLAEAIRMRLQAVEGRAGLETEFQADGLPTLPFDLEDALYAIIYEGLNNSLKHARAEKVTVRLHYEVGENNLICTIRDDGRGFDPQAVLAGGGLGLTSMKERAMLLGGTLTIESASEKGTTIQVKIPVD